jgi:hypothetical protein
VNSPGQFERRPLLFSVLLVAALVGVGLVLHVVFAGVPPGPGRLSLTAGVTVTSLAVALFFASRLGFRRTGRPQAGRGNSAEDSPPPGEGEICSLP